MDEITVPIYLITGFLESGKTNFLNFTIGQDYFQIDGPTLLILCEEGIEEYEEDVLKKSRTFVEVLDNPSQLTTERLVAYDVFYNPARVIIEYNGMWQVSQLENLDMPKGWGISQEIVTVDSTTFQVYMNNMKSLFVEMVRNADMVFFNRADLEMPLAAFRRSVKAVNQAAEVVFENEEGEIDNIFQEAMPYDVNADVIEVMPEDYGIWYMDVLDHPDVYDGKKISFTAMVVKQKELGKNQFVPGRMAMTCCADDTTFIGFVCKSKEASKLRTGSWIRIVAELHFEYLDYYEEEGPVFTAVSIEPTEPLEEELVYFN